MRVPLQLTGFWCWFGTIGYVGRVCDALLLLILLVFPSLLFTARPRSISEIPTVHKMICSRASAPLTSTAIRVRNAAVKAAAGDRNQFVLHGLTHGICGVGIDFMKCIARAHAISLASEDMTRLSFALLPSSGLLSAMRIFKRQCGRPGGLSTVAHVPLHPDRRVRDVSMVSRGSVARRKTLAMASITEGMPKIALFKSCNKMERDVSVHKCQKMPVLGGKIQVSSSFHANSTLSRVRKMRDVRIVGNSTTIARNVKGSLKDTNKMVGMMAGAPGFAGRKRMSLQTND